MIQPDLKHINRRRMAKVLSLGLIFALGACSVSNKRPYESVDFHNDRGQEMAAKSTFYQCRDEALALDKSARTSASPAQYILSARTSDRCLSEIDSHYKAIPEIELMQLHGLSIQNYFIAGDVSRARTQLTSFQQVYTGKDLYYPDNSSFLDSMSLLLSEEPVSAAGRHSLLNAKKSVKSEIRRMEYWKTN